MLKLLKFIQLKSNLHNLHTLLLLVVVDSSQKLHVKSTEDSLRISVKTGRLVSAVNDLLDLASYIAFFF